MPKVELRGVSKTFIKDHQRVRAVRSVSLKVKEGEYLGFLGPSGCGKTTVLRLISGLIQPTKGEILLDGENVHDLPPEERHIGYVFQDYAVFPHLNVWENVSYGLRIRGIPRQVREKKTAEAIKTVGLQGWEKERPNILSAPDLQRTALARVLAVDASLLLFDEALGTFDLRIREQFREELRDLVKDLSLTAIHVTHDQAECNSICDRIAIMRRGKLVQVESPRNLFLNPKTPFVADFLGESQFFDVLLFGRRRGKFQIRIGGSSIFEVEPPKFQKNHKNIRIGRHLVVSIRRELMFLTKKRPITNGILCEVKEDRFSGFYREITVELEDKQHVQIRTSGKGQKYDSGETLWLNIPSDGTQVFVLPPRGLRMALSP